MAFPTWTDMQGELMLCVKEPVLPVQNILCKNYHRSHLFCWFGHNIKSTTDFNNRCIYLGLKTVEICEFSPVITVECGLALLKHYCAFLGFTVVLSSCYLSLAIAGVSITWSVGPNWPTNGSNLAHRRNLHSVEMTLKVLTIKGVEFALDQVPHIDQYISSQIRT